MSDWVKGSSEMEISSARESSKNVSKNAGKKARENSCKKCCGDALITHAKEYKSSDENSSYPTIDNRVSALRSKITIYEVCNLKPDIYSSLYLVHPI